MCRFLNKHNFVMVGSYLLFLFLRGMIYLFFYLADTVTIATVIQTVSIAEYLLVIFIGAYGASVTGNLRSGMVVVAVIKGFTEVYSAIRLVLSFNAVLKDSLSFAFARVCIVVGIALISSLAVLSIEKARRNRK